LRTRKKRKRRGELEKNELRGNHRGEEVEHAGIPECAQVLSGMRCGERHHGIGFDFAA